VFPLNGDLGFGAYMDHHIGQLVSAIDELSNLDKTLIFYIEGDNGRSAEGGLAGIFNQMTSFNVVVGKVKHLLQFD
jgi:arylsulfatase A-like enzyme